MPLGVIALFAVLALLATLASAYPRPAGGERLPLWVAVLFIDIVLLLMLFPK